MRSPVRLAIAARGLRSPRDSKTVEFLVVNALQLVRRAGGLHVLK